MKARTFELLRLDHVVLRSSDPARLVSFYEQLGCKVERTVAGAGFVQMRAGTSMIDIVDINGRTGKTDPGPGRGEDGRNLDHFALRVEPFDAQEILAFCADRKVEAEALKKPLYGADGYGNAVYIRDPDGNRVELKGPPLPASPLEQSS